MRKYIGSIKKRQPRQGINVVYSLIWHCGGWNKLFPINLLEIATKDTQSYSSTHESDSRLPVYSLLTCSRLPLNGERGFLRVNKTIGNVT